MKLTVLVTVMFVFGACDDDFNTVGSEVIGGVNFEDELYSSFPVAYNKVFEKVETNALPVNLIGAYQDPLYGQTKYEVVSQLRPRSFNPNFEDGAVLDSIVLSIPYFSNVVSTQTNESGITSTTYALDSIYGNTPINLKIYESNFFLRDIDGEQEQKYYSDDIKNFGNALKGDLLFEVPNFVPSAEEIKLKGLNEEGDEVSSRISPRLRLVLKASGEDAKPLLVQKFQERFIDQSQSIVFSNENNFNNYFRGIYFHVDADADADNLMLFDISDAQFTLHYSFLKNAGEGDTNANANGKVKDFNDFPFTFANNIINSIDFDFKSDLVGKLEVQDTINGVQNLYIKGGEGAYAVLDLFGKCVATDADGDFIVDEEGNPIFVDCTNTDADRTELDFLKDADWLINDAALKLYVNQEELGTGGATEPERIYIFNLETGTTLVDYTADPTSNGTSPINSAVNHLGRLDRGTDALGDFYRIRLTQHIINILDNTIENTKLGIAVSQNVNVINMTEGVLEKNMPPDTTPMEEIIPVSSVISHEGTVIYGNNTVPEEKQLKLDIFYTRSKSN